jgi:predicted DNA-binding transcriptional regulator YafY
MSVWDGKVVEFTYENHRGVTEIRRIVPMYIWFGETPYHKRKQWFVHGWCFERQAARDFAWSEIQGWAEAEDQSLPWRDGEQPKPSVPQTLKPGPDGKYGRVAVSPTDFPNFPEGADTVKARKYDKEFRRLGIKTIIK